MIFRETPCRAQRGRCPVDCRNGGYFRARQARPLHCTANSLDCQRPRYACIYGSASKSTGQRPRLCRHAALLSAPNRVACSISHGRAAPRVAAPDIRVLKQNCIGRSAVSSDGDHTVQQDSGVLDVGLVTEGLRHLFLFFFFFLASSGLSLSREIELGCSDVGRHALYLTGPR